MPEQEVKTGTVVWFSSAKGFGFIKPDSTDNKDSKDVFVHYTSIVMAGHKSLTTDQKVEFIVVRGKQGLQASDVKVVV